ncbi:MAG: hypothetical protein DIU57_003460 [Pseudomonadota bacterium]|jgi:hypothetical protein|nr:MAG: hypothetical protein DIU57_00750 [Pseudomonadota bacterium]HEX5599252.1 hypothetical protein [Hyphomicrobiaceae bacterium]
MSLRAIPLIAVALILYNAVVLLGGDATPNEILSSRLFEISMLHHNTVWVFTWGDLLILVVLVLLFVELLKATYTTTASLLDHGLSMIVFVVCLVEFLLVPQAASSVFFFITMAALIDVVAGYTIGIRVARRDFQIGE